MHFCLAWEQSAVAQASCLCVDRASRPHEQMEASWDYARRLAQRSEEIGFDLTLIAELSLNDIKGADAPTLDAWSTAAALAAVTKRLELMVAVRPTFHNPALLAKQAANIDGIAGPGRLSLNVVSSWWADEAKKCGLSRLNFVVQHLLVSKEALIGCFVAMSFPRSVVEMCGD